MKKRLVIIFAAALIVGIIFSFKPLMKIASDSFWNFIAEQFEKEEQERRQRIENGEIVAGKDTVLIWENKYEIGHFPDSNHLEIYIDGLINPVLKNVTAHKVKKKNYT